MAHFDLLDELFNLIITRNHALLRNGRFLAFVLATSVCLSIYYSLPAFKISASDIYYDTFPQNFEFGVATASYQIEGGKELRGVNIWDTFTSREGNVEDGSNGDVACDSYNKYHIDVDNVAKLGMDFYRFSISWSRLVPTGIVAEGINEVGIQYYHNLLELLKSKNIKAVVTLYHWDLPQKLQEYGGWMNDTMAQRFQEYANLCYSRFGASVATWITFNEPRETTLGGYEIGYMAPGLKFTGTGTYNTSYTILRAHAAAYRLYHERYADKFNGKVGISLNCDWAQPASESAEDKAAADRFLQWYIGIWAHPILHGDYPEEIKTRVLRKTHDTGFRKSRLPTLTDEEINFIRGTFDFVGLNSYTTRIVEHRECHVNEEETPSYQCDQDLHAYADQKWPTSGSVWLHPVPWGLRKLLSWIKHQYPGYTEVLITENGVSRRLGEKIDLCDQQRVEFYRDYINNVLMSVRIDEVNVSGFTAWSLMDNFEWSRGYTERFGLFHVAFDRADKKRTMKASAYFYQALANSNGFPNKDVVAQWQKDAYDSCMVAEKQLKLESHQVESFILTPAKFVAFLISLIFIFQMSRWKRRRPTTHARD